MDRRFLRRGNPWRVLIFFLGFILWNAHSLKTFASDPRLGADEALELFMQHSKIQSLPEEQRADLQKSASVYATMRPSALVTALQTDLFEHAPSAEACIQVVRVCLAQKKVTVVEDWLRSWNLQHELMPWEMRLQIYRASISLAHPQNIFSWQEERRFMTQPVDWVRVTKCLRLMASLGEHLDKALGWLDQESVEFLRPYPDLTLKVLKLHRHNPLSVGEASHVLFSSQLWQSTTADPSSPEEAIPVQEARKRVADLEDFLMLHKRLGAEKTRSCITFLQTNDLVQKCHAGFPALAALDLVTQLDSDDLQDIFDDLSRKGLIYEFWDTQNILIMLKSTQELGSVRQEALDWFLHSPWKSVAKMAWAIRFVFKGFAHSPETFKTLEALPEGREQILRCEHSFGVLDLIHRLAQQSRSLVLFSHLALAPSSTEATK
ncbi:MAG: hypothetical protein ACK5O7_01795 [Holosporales bacterium]